MLEIYPKSLIISLFIIFSAAIATAQPKDNSPFSQFGVGDFLDTGLPSSQAMGGLGSIYHDFFEANLDNPASLGFLQYTTLQIGMYAKRSSLKRFDDKQTVWSGNLDHLSLNIPIINPLNETLERRETDFSWGTSVSLRPYSQVGYFIRVNDEIDSIGEVERTFTGSGGLYQFTWGNGIKYKNLSAGLNLVYMYGKHSFDEETVFLDLENAYRDIFQSATTYKGLHYRFGMMYEQPLDLAAARAKEDDPTRFLSLGFFIEGKNTLDSKSDFSQVAINTIHNDVDTALFILAQEGEAILPGSYGVGMMYRHAGDFRIGVDYQAGSWSNYENSARPEKFSQMSDSYRLAAGVSWIPDATSITSYFKRVEYRAGFSTQNDPRMIEGEQVKSTAFSLGASFPLILQRNIAWFQVGLDIGIRTGGENLSDNFVRGKVGFVFNDNSWFIRGKYD
jgi:hypothetical protein